MLAHSAPLAIAISGFILPCLVCSAITSGAVSHCTPAAWSTGLDGLLAAAAWIRLPPLM